MPRRRPGHVPLCYQCGTDTGRQARPDSAYCSQRCAAVKGEQFLDAATDGVQWCPLCYSWNEGSPGFSCEHDDREPELSY